MSDPHPIVLVAMGGHAFMQPGEAGTIEDHERNAAGIATLLMTLVERDYYVCITHGNGPQVGNLLLQQEVASASGVPRAAARRAGRDDRGQPRLHPAAGAAQRAAQARRASATS